MRKLSIDVRQYGMPEGIEDNIRYSMSLGLPELQMAPCVNNGTFVICGSGPSIQNHIEDIRDEESPICGVKGAYDFLRDHGITPDLYISVEPRYRKIRNPSKKTSYLLASRCNKLMFDDLKDYCVYLWHSWSEEESGNLTQDKFRIGGGTTSGLRAINVGWCLGFRKFKLYGFDSCLAETGEKRVNEEKLSRDVTKTDVIVGGRQFICNMAMAAQAQDFQEIYNVMPDITVEAVGDGLIPAIIEERKKQGLKI